MSEEQYKYAAFISYRHVDPDRKWAEWLIHALETYRVPKALQKVGFPARIGKVFRDKDELPSDGSLNAQIETALKASRFLVIICSPNTPHSRWVSREIEIFKELGRADKIFPLIIDGEPDESFPKVLTTTKLISFDEAAANPPKKDIEPIGADVRPVVGKSDKEIKKDECIRIVAGLLGCAYDDLKQRDKQREAKKKRQRLLGGIAAVLIALVGGAYYWDYNRIKTDYYIDYSTVYGIPEGLGKVSEKQAKTMNVSYALSYQRRQLIRMQRSKGAQKATALTEDYDVDPWLIGIASWEYEYGLDDRLSEVILKDDKDKTKITQQYQFGKTGDNATVAFRAERGGEGKFGAVSISTGGTLTGLGGTKKSQVSQHYLKFDERGRTIELQFLNDRALSVPDAQGTGGRIYQYDKRGHLTTIGFIDPTEAHEPLTLKNGIHQIQRQVDERGRRKLLTLYAEDGEPILSDRGVASTKQVYDGRGNVIELSYYDTQGKPTLHKDGYASTKQVYDGRGNAIEQSYYDTQGKLTLDKSGVASLKQVYDGRGNVIEQSYYDTQGKPTLDKHGVATYKQVYDGRGNVIEQSYYDTQGKPILHKSGYASYKQVYDGRGNFIEQSYYDTQGKPALDKSGVASVKRIYDGWGNVIEQSYYDTQGKPILHKSGYASTKQVYDGRGNLIEASFYDTQGKLILIKDGYASFKLVYDGRGNVIEQSYYDSQGKPTLDKKGVASFKQVYDGRGNLIEQSYYDTQGKPTLHKDGVASVKRVFDGRGNVIEQSFYDTQGKPTLQKDGVASVKRVFDGRGNFIKESYYDTQGKLTLHKKNGYASTKRIYDGRGLIIEQSYYDAQGKQIFELE
ncbi:MAG: TIR domain-containing protein [Gammaproteobacteria bacterium]|nr:TIR domain-containing protein [Gammaproteobacteria bacterium]